MAGVIPLTVERIVNLTGLNGSLKSNPLWVPHHTAAVAELEKYLYPEYCDYLETGVSETYESHEATLGEMAAAMFTLKRVMPLMNLNTVGSGFVQKTGIDADSTEILSHDSLGKYIKTIEYQALLTIEPYLNDLGLQRLKQLNTTPKQAIKAMLIVNEDNLA